MTDADLAPHVAPSAYARYGRYDSDTDIVGAPVFAANWDCSVVPEVGPVPFYGWDTTKTGAAMVKDCFGYLRTVRTGECRFTGARRVENLVRASRYLANTTHWTHYQSATVARSNDIPAHDGGTEYVTKITDHASNSDSSARQGFGVLPAVKYTFSVWLYAGTATSADIRLYHSGSENSPLAQLQPTLTAGWQRFAITGTPDGATAVNILIAAGSKGAANQGYIYVDDVQLEEVTGHADYANTIVAPSENVSCDDIGVDGGYVPLGMAGVYHGAMVDRVQYFRTAKGNTVNQSTGLVTEATGAVLSAGTREGLLLERVSQNLFTQNETFSTATPTGVTLSASNATAPTGRPNKASTITETSGTSSRYLEFSVAAGSVTNDHVVAVSCVFENVSAGWGRIQLVQKDGSTIGQAWFNLATGAIGTVKIGSTTYTSPWNDEIAAYVEPLAGGRYRCSLCWDVGTGASAFVVRIGMSRADNTASYAVTGGDEKAVRIWGAQIEPDRSMPSSIIITAGSAVERSGVTLSLRNDALVRTCNHAVYCEFVPYYYTGAPTKTSDGITATWFCPWYGMSVAPHNYTVRHGITIRPWSFLTAPQKAGISFDHYNGDPTPALKWTPNTTYAAGAYVVPTATKPLNASPAKKIFRNQAPAGGVSGSSEPTWDATFVATPDNATNITTDGTCRWQANVDNGIDSDYEAYNVVVLAEAFDFRERVKTACWIYDTPTQGMAMNGQLAVRESEPFPIGEIEFYQPPDFFVFGNLGPFNASSTMAIGPVRIYDRQVNVDALVAMTEA